MNMKSQVNYLAKHIPHQQKLTPVDKVKLATHIYHKLKAQEDKKKLELEILKKKEKALNLYIEFLKEKAKTMPFLKDFAPIHF